MSQQTGSSPPSSPVASQAARDAKGKGRASSPPSTPIASQTARDALAKGRAQVAANVTYSVALQNLGPGSITSSQRRARIAVRFPTPVPQPQQPLQSPPPFRTTPHPNDPLQTKHQWQMLNAFVSWGRLGLSKFIYKEARARAPDHFSWNLLADDEEKERYVYQLLHLLPDRIITSLIKNTLSFDYHHDLEVKRFVNSDMIPKEMQPMAGIYINIARRSKLGLMPNVMDQHAGKWLSSKQVKSLIDKVKVYVANKPDPNSLAANRGIDTALGRFNPSTTLNGRRFALLPDTISTTRVNQWLKIIEHQYRTNVSQNDLNIPFQRCPMEVGWAQDINTRLKAHVNNNSTTPLFGLVNAISRQSVIDGGAAFPPPMQLVLFPIWKDDGDLKKIAEILGSVLCSSYWIYGGLNYAWAGGSVNVTFNDPEADIWINSAEKFDFRINREGVTDFARIVQLGEHAEKARQKSAAKAKEQASRVEVDYEKQKANSHRTAIQDLKAEKAALERQRKEKSRKRIEEGDEWMEEFERILEPMDRERKVNETVNLLHRLGRAKDRGDKDAIAEVEDEIAEVDWEILEAAITKADELADRARVKLAVSGETVMKEKAEPENSQRSEDRVIDLRDD